jgi:hypothetical protein
MLLAAFQQFDLQPGPLIFTTNPALVWGLIASLYLGNAMLLLLNLPLAPLWAQLLRIPAPTLYGGILVFATLGTYSLNHSVFDVGLMYVIGTIGFVMRRVDVPVAPALLDDPGPDGGQVSTSARDLTGSFRSSDAAHLCRFFSLLALAASCPASVAALPARAFDVLLADVPLGDFARPRSSPA